ncbi:MAG: molybdate ABC transporter substrate-binding protein [Lewinella sp.]|nr:molybdate ABC transporter substrate-binding protein [Lewinella sp.]
MKRLTYGFLLLTVVACTREPSHQTTDPVSLRIAVAANAQYAVDSIVAAFTTRYAIPVSTMVSSSGKLTAQIRQSAPYDLFLSADLDYPRHLFEQGLATAPPVVYAFGELILWAGDTSLDLSRPAGVLQEAGVRRIAIAQARTAPYGRAAEAWLAHHQLRPAIAGKLVYGESIAQVNSYLLSGAAELAFTALSVVQAPELRMIGQYQILDPATYPPLAQGMVLTRYGQEQHPEVARAFYDFVLGPEGQEILQQFGYRPGSSVPLPDHGEQ